MPAERIPIPADLLKWFNYKSRTRGRDWFVDVVHISPHTIAKIREDGKATPSCIAKIERARNNDPSYRKEVSYKHAVEMLRSGVSMRSVQIMLGHKDVTTTMIYTELTSDDVLRDVERARERR